MTDPFPYLIKIFAIAYRVTQVLVKPDLVDAGELLERAQSDLNAFNATLPSELAFETSSFRSYATISQGGAFVLIHVRNSLLPLQIRAANPNSYGSIRELRGDVLLAAASEWY